MHRLGIKPVLAREVAQHGDVAQPPVRVVGAQPLVEAAVALAEELASIPERTVEKQPSALPERGFPANGAGNAWAARER